MATKKSKKPTQPRLTLHQLLGALSFWGSSVRLLLMAFLVGAVFIMRLIYLTTSVEWEVGVTVYILGSLAVLDIGYIMLARAFPLSKKLDVFCLLTIEALLVLSYILPKIVVVGALGWFSTWTILIVLLVLGIRGLLGLLFADTKKRA